MGNACCIAVKDKTIVHGLSSEVVHRNIRHSPAWSLRWDNRGRVAGEETSVNWVSDDARGNDGSDVKYKSMFASEEGSPMDNFRSVSWQKSPFSEGTAGHAKTPVSDQSISRSTSMDMNSEQVKESIESPTPSHLESPAPSHPSPVNPFLPPHPASSTPSRWAYRSRIPGMKSPSSDSISEERPVLPPLSNDSTRASRGGSSDGWSMNAYSELTATPHRERWSFDSESSGLNHDKLTRSSSRVSSSTSVDLQACGVCSKYLTEKSLRNSQKIFSGNELAVVAVLICGHAYHADCLEHMTPEVNKYDPACPVCTLGEKQTLKLSRKTVKAGMVMQIGKKKRSRHTNVYSHVTGDSVEFERMKNSEHERKGGAKMASSSSTTKPPFLKRHFSFGSKVRSSSGNHSTKKKSFFWAKSSKV